MKIIFSQYAQQELYEAADYLELEFEGLGGRFKSEVKSAAERIARHQERDQLNAEM